MGCFWATRFTGFTAGGGVVDICGISGLEDLCFFACLVGVWPCDDFLLIAARGALWAGPEGTAATCWTPKLSNARVVTGFTRCLGTCGRGLFFPSPIGACRVPTDSSGGKSYGEGVDVEPEADAVLPVEVSAGRKLRFCFPYVLVFFLGRTPVSDLADSMMAIRAPHAVQEWMVEVGNGAVCSWMIEGVEVGCSSEWA
jgi:hypothetical protein